MSPDLKAKLLERGPLGSLFFKEGPEVVALIEKLESDLVEARQNSVHAATLKQMDDMRRIFGDPAKAFTSVAIDPMQYLTGQAR